MVGGEALGAQDGHGTTELALAEFGESNADVGGQGEETLVSGDM